VANTALIRRFLPSVLWALLILLVSLTPGSDMPRVTFSDKFAHAFVYFVLTILLGRAWLKQDHKVGWRKRAFLYAFLVSLLFGMALEVIQEYFIEGRKGELLDVAANAAGALLAFPMHRLLRGGSFT